MNLLQNILLFCITNAMKVGNILSILLLLPIVSFEEINPGGNWFITFLVFCAVVMIAKLILGGWNASSIKGMALSCVFSTIGAIGFVVYGMKLGGGGSLWMCCVPIVLGAILGIWAANWMEELLSEQQAENFSLDSVVDSIFDNGLKGTFNSFINSVEAQMYWAYSRGVAVYSNTCFLTGLILFLIYR